ncbi:hypothetical protein Tco_1404738 [Tanacetum coccineum]
MSSPFNSTSLKSIPPGIDDDNLDPEGEIHLVERLLYDNSSPRPPEEFNSENPTESFSPSPIPIEDSDSLMEEIDIFLDGDESIPPDNTPNMGVSSITISITLIISSMGDRVKLSDLKQALLLRIARIVMALRLMVFVPRSLHLQIHSYNWEI